MQAVNLGLHPGENHLVSGSVSYQSCIIGILLSSKIKIQKAPVSYNNNYV